MYMCGHFKKRVYSLEQQKKYGTHKQFKSSKYKKKIYTSITIKKFIQNSIQVSL